MDTIHSNINLPLFSSKQSKINEYEVNKYTTKMILSNIIDDKAITRFNKQTLKKNPSMQFENTNNNCSVTISPVIVYKNNKIKSKNSLNIGDYTTENQTVSCKNVEIDEVFITSDCSKNVSIKTINKMQKNISFSNEKLWEINRVNQILHNKITNGAKPTYTRIKPPTLLVKATSTINRERKNKDIVKENEILAKKLKNVRSTIFK